MNSAIFRASFRFWSDGHDLTTLTHTLDINIAHFHVKGQEIFGSNGQSLGSARRYFICSQDECFDNAKQIIDWAEPIMIKIDDDFVRLMHLKKIEGVLWISIHGDARINLPRFPRTFIKFTKSLGMALYFENFTTKKVSSRYIN